MIFSAATPQSDNVKKALALELYDRAIANPLADQEAIFRDLLLGSYDSTRNDTDKYIKEKEQQLDKLIGAKPSMSDTMTPPPPRRSPVGAVSQAERLTT